MIRTPGCNNIYRSAMLVALACVLQVAESVIPYPIPGLRLGLANVITLIALSTMGLAAALEITLLRTVLASLVTGSFLSPGFILSFTSGILSTLVMGGLFLAARSPRGLTLSLLGVSVAGALVHNIVQLFLAYWLLVRHPGVFVFFPWLAVGALFTGWLTGAVAVRVCRDIRATGMPAGLTVAPAGGLRRIMGAFVAGASPVHRMPASLKLALMALVSALLFWAGELWVCAVVLVLVLVAGWMSGTPVRFFGRQLRRNAALAGVAFVFPFLFGQGTHVLWQAGALRLTVEGLDLSSVSLFRITALVWLSSLLVRTTPVSALAVAIAGVLVPLRVLGISGRRTARILSLSWIAIPAFLDVSRRMLRGFDLRSALRLSRMVPLLSGFITRLYLEAADAASASDGAAVSLASRKGA